MKGLKKITLSIALVACAADAGAELQILDDTAMGQVTGQAGVTLELETQVDIGQISYRDEGALNINNLSLSGANGSVLDNLKITLDIAGDGEVLESGFSEIARRASLGLLNTSNPDVADALAKYSVGGSFGKQFNSGDLVIHIGPNGTGDPALLDDYLSAIDFELSIDAVEARGATDSTTLFSNINLKGYLGPTDIVVRNGGSATHQLANGNQVSNAEVEFETHFAITEGSLNWDVSDVILIFNFAAVGIEGLQVHNRRGNDTLGHFGMASASATLASGTSGATGKSGLSVHNVDFRADIDMPVFKVGGTSIGAVSFTDFSITNTAMLIYGH